MDYMRLTLKLTKAKQTSEKILHGNDGGDDLHGGSNSHFLTLDSGVLGWMWPVTPEIQF